MRTTKTTVATVALLMTGTVAASTATAAAATDTKPATFEITQSQGHKEMVFRNATVTATAGAPKIETKDGKSGYLPKSLVMKGKKYDLKYSVKGATVTATLKTGETSANGVTPYGYWGCVAKGTGGGALGGAAAGAVTGLLGGPFAEVTVPAGAGAGVLTGGVGGGVTSLVTCS